MRRTKRIIASCVAGALIIGLSIYSIVLQDQKNSLRNQLASFYQKSFEELMTDMDSLQTKLNKLEAANGTNQYSMLLMDVWRQTGDTEGAIATLPVSYIKTSPLTQFMNRTGDYCRYLSKKLAVGEEITEEDMEQIRSLATSCGEISGSLDELWAEGYPGEAGFSEDVFMTEGQGDLEGNLDFTNQEFPRLMYDGPFSESTENKEPKGLGKNTVSKEQAADAAAKFLGIDAASLQEDSEQNGVIPCYGYTGEANGIPFSIYITKQGGQVLWYMSHRDTGISAVPTDEKYEALTKVAQQYAKDKGYGETEPSYAQFYGGMAVINLAPVEDNVVLYPDLIKVWVDIAKSEAAGIDTNNYLMSHTERRLPKPTLTELQAKEKIHKNLAIDSVRLALIPLESGKEKLCYEFTGTINEKDFIIYINAESGLEEDILMIQHTNEGTLVM